MLESTPPVPSCIVLQTERLTLRHLTDGDAAFILALLNDPAFLQYIGDKGVRTEDDARRYIADGPVASYAKNGFGLYHVSLTATGEAVGMCGLVSRPVLTGPDIGYAMLPRFRSMGYATEAARAVLQHAQQRLGYGEVLAIVSLNNEESKKLLRKIGMTQKGTMRMSEEGEEVGLFST